MQGFERYTILEEIASGSTATVYLAEDAVLRRKVALKILHPHLYGHAELVKRFEKEAFAIAALSHENIIKIFEFGRDGRRPYLAMEYIEGETLETLLKANPSGLPNLVAAAILIQVLEGLGAAHAHGICHRDIKPSNVLLDRAGRVRIADFGVAYLSEDTSITRTGSFLGTPGYSAPEQIEGKAITDRTDIFPAGILLYRCLTGRQPFEGETPHAVLVAILERTPARLSAHTRKLLPGWQELIDSMLHKDPARRPTAAACLENLGSMIRETGLAANPACLAGFRADGPAHRAREEGLLAGVFLDKARRARRRAQVREAIKGYALAEAFRPGDEAPRRESESLLARARSRSRKRAFAAALALIAVVGALAKWGMDRSPDPGLPRPAERTPAFPAMVPAAGPTPIPVSFPHPAAERREAAATAPAVAKRRTSPAAGTRPAPPGSPAPSAVAAARGRNSQAGAEAVRASQSAGGAELPAYVIVRTNPPFASLSVDGADAGRTPTREPLRIGPGRHGLWIERDGCKPLHHEFRVAPGDTARLRFTLEKAAP